MWIKRTEGGSLLVGYVAASQGPFRHTFLLPPAGPAVSPSWAAVSGLGVPQCTQQGYRRSLGLGGGTELLLFVTVAGSWTDAG